MAAPGTFGIDDGDDRPAVCLVHAGHAPAGKRLARQPSQNPHLVSFRHRIAAQSLDAPMDLSTILLYAIAAIVGTIVAAACVRLPACVAPRSGSRSAPTRPPGPLTTSRRRICRADAAIRDRGAERDDSVRLLGPADSRHVERHTHRGGGMALPVSWTGHGCAAARCPSCKRREPGGRRQLRLVATGEDCAAGAGQPTPGTLTDCGLSRFAFTFEPSRSWLRRLVSWNVFSTI